MARKKYDFLAAIQLCKYEYKWLAYRRAHRNISERRALRAFCSKMKIPFELPCFEIGNSRDFLGFLYGYSEQEMNGLQ